MRKPIFILLALLSIFSQEIKAQYAPQGFTYQCVVREANGDPLANQTVSLLFALKSGAANGPIVYGETHTASTNEFGLVNLIIGKGTPVQGAFNAINWGGGAKFVTVSLESSPGVYDELGTSEFQSVPYALYAASAPGGGGGGDDWGNQVVERGPELKGNGTLTNPLELASQDAQVGQVLKWSGSRWVPQDDIANSGANGGTVTQVNTGGGLVGGPILTTGTIELSNTGVTPGAYGSATEIPVITIDAKGRITNVWKVVPQPGTVGITGNAGITVQQNGTNFTITNTGDTNASDDITNSTTANGDISGVFTNLQLKNDVVTTAEILDGTIRPSDLNSMNAQSGQVLKWNGTTWAPSVDNTGISSVTINAGTGISVNGSGSTFVIQNTGDTDPSDDLSLTTTAGGDVSGVFSDLQLKNGVVGSTELGTDAVIASKIADGAVTNTKIATNAVTTTRIANGAVTSSKIEDEAITASKLAQMGATAGEVLKWSGSAWVASDDVTGNVVLNPGVAIGIMGGNGAYTIFNTGDQDPNDDITDVTTADGDISGVFSNLQIRAGRVTTTEILDNTIQSQDIRAAAVTTDKVEDLAVTEAKLAEMAVGNTKLKDFAITSEKLARMGATTGQVLKWDGTLWSPANDLTGTSGGTYTAGAGIKVMGTVISNTGDLDGSDDLNLSTIFGGDVQGTYSDLRLKDNTVASTEIVNGTVITEDLADGAVIGAKINRMSAAVGQVLKWNGTTWTPSADLTGTGGTGGNTYTAGSGIGITGVAPNLTITNTGDNDNSATNEIQDLSLMGTILRISGSQSQVDLSGLGGTGNSNTYSAGNGINISGTAPNFVITNAGDTDNDATNELQELELSGTVLRISGTGSQVDLSGLAGSGGTGQWTASGANIYPTPTGNVLIGQTASNSGRLQVTSTNTADEALVLNVNNPSSAKSALVATTNGSGIGGFFTSGTGPALVTGNGAVGIGVATPNAQLHIQTGVNTPLLLESKKPVAAFKNIDKPAEGYVTLEIKDFNLATDSDSVSISLKPNNQLALNANPRTGNVAIGGMADTPYKFEIQHDDYGLSLYNIANRHNWEMWTDDTGRLVFFNDQLPAGVAAGFFAVNGTYTSSDRRLKDDIQPVFGVLNKIKNIPAVTYRFKNSDERTMGFLAQDVQAAFPELVQTSPSRDGKSGYLAVNYGAMTAVVLQAVREQQSEIEALQAENAALKAKMDSIEARLQKLEDK